jgi:hypothetical protein
MQTSEIVAEHKDVGIRLQRRGWGRLRDHKGGDVTVIWEGMPKGLFRLKKDDIEVVINKHELQYLLRNV